MSQSNSSSSASRITRYRILTVLSLIQKVLLVVAAAIALSLIGSLLLCGGHGWDAENIKLERQIRAAKADRDAKAEAIKNYESPSGDDKVAAGAGMVKQGQYRYTVETDHVVIPPTEPAVEETSSMDTGTSSPHDFLLRLGLLVFILLVLVAYRLIRQPASARLNVKPRPPRRKGGGGIQVTSPHFSER